MRHILKTYAARCLDALGIIDRFEKRRNVIHVLMFHQVNHSNNAMGLSINPDLFEELVVFLKSRYELINFDQAVERLTTNDQPTGCVLTFDDGYRDNYDFAFPILKKHAAPATIFVTLDALDSGIFGWGMFDKAIISTNAESLDLQSFGLGTVRLAGQERQPLIHELHRSLKTLSDSHKREIVDYVIANYGDENNTCRTMLTWDEAKEMADSTLVTIGAHTITHPILSRTNSNQAHNEIIEGKTRIEGRLGLPVHYFAYPNGSRSDFNDEHVAMAQSAGYRAACSTIAGNNSVGCDLFTLKRIDVTTRMCTDASGCFSPALFSATLSGLYLRGSC